MSIPAILLFCATDATFANTLSEPTPPVTFSQADTSCAVDGGITLESDQTQPTTQPQPSTGAEGEIVVTARRTDVRGDPLQSTNLKSYRATQAFDGAVVEPVAKLYQDGVPEPVRDGLRNVLKNLHEPVVAVNFLLQGKVGKAGETLGRFVVNSTLGVVGVFDVAKRRPFRLPRRRNGFADTLGFYGVKPGAYLFLPLVGPTTPRDLLGDVVDRLLLPTIVKGPFKSPTYTVPAALLGTIDRRVQLDQELRNDVNGKDAYVARRDAYLCQRQLEIEALRGRASDKLQPHPPGCVAAPLPAPAVPAAAAPIAPSK